MPTWTISAPKEFRESVQGVAKKLHMSYGKVLRNAWSCYLEHGLKEKDFERARKLMELRKKKEQLKIVRERATLIGREKRFAKRNVQAILDDLKYKPELRKEYLEIAETRDRLSSDILKLDKELNPTEEDRKTERLIKALMIITKKRGTSRARRYLIKIRKDKDERKKLWNEVVKRSSWVSSIG